MVWYSVIFWAFMIVVILDRLQPILALSKAVIGLLPFLNDTKKNSSYLTFMVHCRVFSGGCWILSHLRELTFCGPNGHFLKFNNDFLISERWRRTTTIWFQILTLWILLILKNRDFYRFFINDIIICMNMLP